MFNKVFSCPKCGNTIKINLFDYVTDTSSYDRPMGDEIEHSIECDDICPTCNYKYTISGAIWEYSVGAENYNDLKIS